MMHFRSRWLTIALLLLVGWRSRLQAEDASRVGYRRTTLQFKDAADQLQRRQLDLWYPTGDKEEPYSYGGQKGLIAKEGAVAKGLHPIIVFSHGYLGASDQSIFLTEACARAGYVVASLNHADGLADVWKQKRDPPRFAEFAKWTDDKYRDRHDDVVALLDALETWQKSEDSPLADHLDLKRIGGLGHSFGGYTMLGLAGGWKSWKEPRIKAAVLLSPYAQPYDVNGTLEQVGIPVMLQGGTFDFGITPFLTPVYKKLGGPKTYLVLKNETHFGWTNLIALGKSTQEAAAAGNPELIVKYTTAFFDQHLRGRALPQECTELRERLEVYKSAR